MKKLDSTENILIVNGKAADVHESIRSLRINDWRFKLMLSNPAEFYLRFGLKHGRGHVVGLDQIDVMITQETHQLAKVHLLLQEVKATGVTIDSAIVKRNAKRSEAFAEFVAIIEGALSSLPTTSAEVGELDDVERLMAMTEASGSSDAATMRLIEIAKRHEEAGNQVEALLILAPMAAKYCIPAIDALTRISAEKGDMAGLQSWSTQKAQALQIVSSGKGSPVSGVPRNILPQLAALGFVATNMNLIGIKNELGDINAMQNEDYDSGDSDSGFSDSFGDFF